MVETLEIIFTLQFLNNIRYITHISHKNIDSNLIFSGMKIATRKTLTFNVGEINKIKLYFLILFILSFSRFLLCNVIFIIDMIGIIQCYLNVNNIC